MSVELTSGAPAANVSIRRMTSLADVRALHSIWNRCFAEEPSTRWYYHIPSDASADSAQNSRAVQHAKEAYTNRLFLNPRVHIFFAYDDETGEPVGISSWEAPSTSPCTWRQLTLAERLWRLAYSLWDAVMLPLGKRFAPVGPILVKRERWRTLQDGFKARHVTLSDVSKGYWTLDWLGVLPSHGRRGIAKQLLFWGLQEADAQDRAVYLSASPQGLGLYAKLGFVALEGLECFPGEEMGGWTETYMRRPPLSERKSA